MLQQPFFSRRPERGRRATATGFPRRGELTLVRSSGFLQIPPEEPENRRGLRLVPPPKKT